MSRLLAIDPGREGGIAYLDANETPCCVAMPLTEGDIISTLRSIIANQKIDAAYVEEVGKGVIPGRAVSMIVLNVNAAVIRTALACFGVRVVMVKPRTWQETYGLGKRKDCASDTIWKNKLKAEAQRRFPNCDITLSTADSLLILDYARKQ